MLLYAEKVHGVDIYMPYSRYKLYAEKVHGKKNNIYVYIIFVGKSGD